MFPKIKAFFHKKKLMFRLHVSFRETIHPVKVHWFALSNLTLTLMAVKLRSLRSRDRHKGQRQCGSPMECSPGELGEFIKASTWVGKKCRKQKPKRKTKQAGKDAKTVCIAYTYLQNPPLPPKVFFAEINVRWGSPGWQKFGASEDSEMDGSFWGTNDLRYLNQREILVDFYGVFAVVFVEKRLAMSIFVGKKCREKKIHNSYIDITYIDTYAKLHINQEKIYIAHIQIYMYMYIYIYI